MARYPYDVNTTRRYIDVNKQFNGGLKTIDTDDSLGAVFLRQAENVSLSEFGFIEKRYGTYEKDKISIGANDEQIQGFWEYVEEDGTVNEIAIVGGKLYLRLSGQSTFTEITKFKKEGAFKYDDSVFGTAYTLSDFLNEPGENYQFTFDYAGWRADTGIYFSNTGLARTSKKHLTDIAGFNVLSELSVSVTNDAYSYIVFWDEQNQYLGYYGSPQNTEYSNSSGSITQDLSEDRLGAKPIGTQKFTLPEGAAYIAFVMDNATYTDDDGNTKYFWGQTSAHSFNDFNDLILTDEVGGKEYNLTSEYYPFQTNKEIEAALVKDTMYIFNGTYPIYYRGGSIFYVFPIYRPSSVEIANAGHNFLESRNFEEVYGFSGDEYHLDSADNHEDPSLDFEDLEINEGPEGFPITPRVSFTKQEFYPKLPFAVRGQREGEINFELNYNYGPQLGKSFDPFEYGSDTEPENVDTSNDHTNINYRMYLKDISYAAVNSTNAQEYVKISADNIENASTFNNYTTNIVTSNLNYRQFRVRDTDGRFTTLLSENLLNSHPSPTHGGYVDSNGDLALNPDSTKRNFIGKEVRHPHGISQLWHGINDRSVAISIEDEIVRTKESGNLAGNRFGIRFKRQNNAITSNNPTYEFFDWNSNYWYSNNNPLNDKTNSEKFIVLIRPNIGNATTENKEYWKLLYNDPGTCYFNNGILEFVMPEFPDQIDNELVTGYSIHIKTVDLDKVSTKTQLANYKENYNGKAHRSLIFAGTNTGGGLRNIWPEFGVNSLFDYNLVFIEGPIQSSTPFGQPFKATISKLIPGTYDFKLTFALEENEIPIIQPYELEDYKGEWESDYPDGASTGYSTGDIVQYTHTYAGFPFINYYRSTANNNHNHTPVSSVAPNGSITIDSHWESVSYFSLLDAQDIASTTQYISVYFRNIEIFGQKITDYNKVQEEGKSPLLSCTKVTEHYGKLLVYGSEELPESVFVSFPDNFSYYPSLFRLEFFSPSRDAVQAVTPFMDVLVTQTDTMTWGIRGTSPLVDAPEPYATFMITPAYGTIAPKSVQIVRNKLFFLSHLGVVSLHSLYAVDQQYNVKHEDTLINNIVPHDAKAVAIQFDNQYWLNFPESGITLRWYANKNSWVQDKFKTWTDFDGVFKWQIVGDELEFITYKSILDSGNPSIYRVGIDYTLPHDMREPISSLFETSFLNQNYPFHPKNYKEAKLDFTLQNEYNKGRLPFYESSQDGGLTTTADTISISGLNAFLKNHKYRVEFIDDAETNPITHIPLTSVSIEGNPAYATTPTPVLQTGQTDTMIYEFFITNDYEQGSAVDFYISGVTSVDLTQIDSVTLRDVTYDDELSFDTYIISEDQTLNFDNYSGYTQATVDVGVDLKEKERLGDWKFGSSDFGKKVTAVKTIKLSGKGYNSKLYLEDTSSSKWTLESLGITYKMRRARSK